MNNKIKKKSPAKFLLGLGTLASIGVIAGAVGMISAGKKDRALRRKLSDAQGDFDVRLKEYEDSQFKPIDPDLVDQENVFEDMEIDTTSFELQRKAFLQQQANIMQSLQMVGGSSGAAGLATALSNAADQQTEQMGMTISQAIGRAKELRLQEESRINQAVTNVKLANAEGSRQFEMDKLSTMLGVAGQKIAGIRGDQAGRRQMYGQMAAGIGSIVGGGIGSGQIDIGQ